MENSSKYSLLLVMRQQSSCYAVPAEHVVEIITLPAVTALPLQPDYLLGIFSYKGHILPVLSLGALSGQEAGISENTDSDPAAAKTAPSESVMVVVQLGDKYLALAADSAESLIEDDGTRLVCDESLMNRKLLKLSCALPGDPAVLVLDLQGLYSAFVC